MVKKLLGLLFLLTALCLTAGCAPTITTPVDAYQPQNYTRLTGETALGEFLYQPFIDGKVKRPNHVRSTALGTQLLSMDVAEYVKKATALELEKTGVLINPSAGYVISGNVLNLTCDDFGFTADVIYVIQYTIKDKSGQIVFDKVFTPLKTKMSKFHVTGESGPIYAALVAKGYDMFIADPQVQSILEIKNTKSKK